MDDEKDRPDGKPPDATPARETWPSKTTETPKRITSAPKPPPPVGRPWLRPRKFRRPTARYEYLPDHPQESRSLVKLAQLDAMEMDPVAGCLHVVKAFLPGICKLRIAGVDDADDEIHRFWRWLAIYQGMTVGSYSEPSAELEAALNDLPEYRQTLRDVAIIQAGEAAAAGAVTKTEPRTAPTIPPPAPPTPPKAAEVFAASPAEASAPATPEPATEPPTAEQRLQMETTASIDQPPTLEPELPLEPPAVEKPNTLNENLPVSPATVQRPPAKATDTGIGQIIRRYRQLRGFTVEELAVKVNMTGRAINNIENHKTTPHVRNLKALADALKIPNRLRVLFFPSRARKPH